MRAGLAAAGAGNLLPEFGFGKKGEAAEVLVASFETTYCLKQMRMTGDELRLLRAYPGDWQVGWSSAASSDRLPYASSPAPSPTPTSTSRRQHPLWH